MIRPMAWRLLLPCLFLAGSSPVLAGTQQWTFQVFLDDMTTGSPVFTLPE